jgi:hypothetical protein
MDGIYDIAGVVIRLCVDPVANANEAQSTKSSVAMSGKSRVAERTQR